MEKDSYANIQSQENFNKVRSKEVISRIFNLLHPEKNKLLSFYDIKDIIRPQSEIYIGMQVVELDSIIGSEGRYKDFNNSFLPKHNYMRHRWESIDQAVIKDIILPPIKLYKIGDVYFVRDGNHRVSVSRTQGIMAIDAEVVELKSSNDFILKPGMTQNDILKELIKYERNVFLNQKNISNIIDCSDIHFTTTGRFDEILHHIEGHGYFLGEKNHREFNFEEAAVSWYETLFYPIINIIKADGLIFSFPGRTEADLYMWAIQHWDNLKKRFGDDLSMDDAINDFSNKFGKNIFWQTVEKYKLFLLGFFKRK